MSQPATPERASTETSIFELVLWAVVEKAEAEKPAAEKMGDVASERPKDEDITPLLMEIDREGEDEVMDDASCSALDIEEFEEE